MFALISGILVGVVSILMINLIGKSNSRILYGIVLAGIAFLYVGFTWSDYTQLTITIAQALVFIVLAYVGTLRNVNILALGYILHGIWDVLYTYFTSSDLVPPHYDVFCLTIDVIMGAYIFFYRARIAKPA